MMEGSTNVLRPKMSTFGDNMTNAITRRTAKLAKQEPKPKADEPKDDKDFADKAKDFLTK